MYLSRYREDSRISFCDEKRLWRKGIGVRCERQAGLIGALITHLTRHGVSDQMVCEAERVFQPK